MMARNYDRDIVECARRMTRKVEDSKWYTQNGEFSPEVRKEIARMVAHCEKKQAMMIADNSGGPK